MDGLRFGPRSIQPEASGSTFWVPHARPAAAAPVPQAMAFLLRALETCAGLTEIRIEDRAAYEVSAVPRAQPKRLRPAKLTAEQRAAAAEKAFAEQRAATEEALLQAEALDLERERLYRTAESALTVPQGEAAEGEALRLRRLLRHRGVSASPRSATREADRLTSKAIAAGLETELLTVLEAVAASSSSPSRQMIEQRVAPKAAPATPAASPTSCCVVAPAVISSHGAGATSSRRHARAAATGAARRPDYDDFVGFFPKEESCERWPECNASPAERQAEKTRRAKKALDARPKRKSVVPPQLTAPGGVGTRERILSRGF